MSELTLQPLTVVIPTLDEEALLPDCLTSVAWADQVLVVDCGSTDATVEQARVGGARVIERPFTGYGEQRNHGVDCASHDWILCIDADERVPPRLREEIVTVLHRPQHPGYFIPRTTVFAGRVIRHCGWQRDRVLRLYDRRRGSWDARAVHERVVLEGEPGYLRTPISHQTYRNLAHFTAKSLRYAALGAEELHRSRRRSSLAHLLFLPLARFLKMYVLERGFLDGVPGAMVCAIASYGVFLKYAHLWELNRAGGSATQQRAKGRSLPPPTHTPRKENETWP